VENGTPIFSGVPYKSTTRSCQSGWSWDFDGPTTRGVDHVGGVKCLDLNHSRRQHDKQLGGGHTE